MDRPLITEKTPSTWQELQNWCKEILKECGFDAKTEHTVQLVRGKAEVDIFAKEVVEGREYLTIIECKHWTSRVPQAVVHGFRTVVVDLGANSGYIVSKAGFQTGAYEAAENTNIKLVTWEEFQEEFVEQWYWEYLTKYVVENIEPLSSYIEPLPAMSHWDMYLDDEDVERLVALYERHAPLTGLIMALSPYLHVLNPKFRQRLKLPLSNEVKQHLNLPEGIYARTGYREFLNDLTAHCLPILEEFRSFRDKALERKDRGEKPRR
jgi:hypothetical protein